MSMNLIVLLLVGVGILFTVLIACVILLLLKKGGGRPGTTYSGSAPDNSMHHKNDAHMRTFALLDDGNYPDRGAKEQGFGQPSADMRNKTVPLHGSGAVPPPPEFQQNTSKTVPMFQGAPQMGGMPTGQDMNRTQSIHSMGGGISNMGGISGMGGGMGSMVSSYARINFTTVRGSFTYDMNTPVVCIGRDNQGNDIVVEDDGKMGRMHAILMYKNNRLYFLDLNSRNGSYIKGINQSEYQKITGLLEIPQQAFLRLADTSFQVEAGR